MISTAARILGFAVVEDLTSNITASAMPAILPKTEIQTYLAMMSLSSMDGRLREETYRK